MDIDTTAAGESGLKIKFFADKKKSGGGAQCTVQCTEAAGIYRVLQNIWSTLEACN